MDEIGNLWSQHNDVRKCRNAGNTSIKTFERRTRLGEERIIGGPVGELGPAVGVASRAGRLEVGAHLQRCHADGTINLFRRRSDANAMDEVGGHNLSTKMSEPFLPACCEFKNGNPWVGVILL